LVPSEDSQQKEGMAAFCKNMCLDHFGLTQPDKTLKVQIL